MTKPCGSGLSCEAGSQKCVAPGGVGDACHLTRPCGSGLTCAPGVHKCYHERREACEPCSAGYECRPGLSCQAFEQICRGPMGYDINVVWAPSPPGVKQPSTAVKNALTAAVDRWRRVLRDHLDPQTVTMPENKFKDWIKAAVPVGRSWSDLTVVVRIAGPNEDAEAFKAGSKVLAHAAEAWEVNGMPRLGYIEINQDKMDSATIKYTEEVLMHEIGHILGMNARMFERKNLLSADRRYFVGENAVAAYKAVGGTGSIPLQWDEAEGHKPGGHWSPSTFDAELMTPSAHTVLDIAANMPISKVTLGALRDFGYKVNECEGVTVARKSGAGSGPEGRPTPSVSARQDEAGEIYPGDGHWGSWRERATCRAGTFASGFKLRVEGKQGNNDDSALNSVRLRCTANTGGTDEISSHDGFWGGWGNMVSCPVGDYIDKAKIRIEGQQGNNDDSAANDVSFGCRGGAWLSSTNGRPWGDWGGVATCPAGAAVCGLSVRLEDQQGNGDDSAMNGLRLQCCKLAGVASSSPPSSPSALTHGVRVALYSPAHKRFLVMNDQGAAGASAQVDTAALPADWQWERFRVFDGGNGTVAFQSMAHQRFLRITDQGVVDSGGASAQLPREWSWERFVVKPTADGAVGLWCPSTQRFLRMKDDGGVDSTHVADGTLPESWHWERFRIVILP